MNNTENTPHKFYERLASVETEVRNLKEDFNEFCNNHFETFKLEIRNDIKCLIKKVNARPTWLMAIVGSLFVALVTFIITYFATK